MTPLHIEHEAPLKALNSFGISATANELITLNSNAQLPLLHALFLARKIDGSNIEKPIILGGGSNVLITKNLLAPVVLVRLMGKSVLSSSSNSVPFGAVLVEAAAGESWHEFVRWTLEQGLSGLENLSMIPGTVGASPIQNIGAYGVELADTFDSLEAFNLSSGETRRFNQSDCAFEYRESLFKREHMSDWLIISVRFKLNREFSPQLSYAELAKMTVERFGKSATKPGFNALQLSDLVCEIRRRKLPDPAIIGNAGSFFKNPVVPKASAPTGDNVPRYPANSPDQVKLSAGWLIDQCGWKGYRDGDAGVHAAHALVLVNYGDSSGSSLRDLAQSIQESVRTRFGIRLEAEPRML
jgi:UDP-N-acetylmuramate dehydrogenase